MYIAVVGVAGDVSIPTVRCVAMAPTVSPAPGRGQVEARSPPSACPSAKADADAKAGIEPVEAIAKAKAPTIPGVIGHIETPGPGPGIVIGPDPGRIIKAGAIDDSRPIAKAVQVTRRITHIDIVGV